MKAGLKSSYLLWKQLAPAAFTLLVEPSKQELTNLKKVLKALFNLFHDSPAQRDVYIRINCSSTFAERFCPTRWVENEPVADRAIHVWDNVVTVVDHYETLTVSKRPQNNKSYETLVCHKNDIVMKVKFCIFRDLAHRFNVYLVKFQTDAPMMPIHLKVG